VNFTESSATRGADRTRRLSETVTARAPGTSSPDEVAAEGEGAVEGDAAGGTGVSPGVADGPAGVTAGLAAADGDGLGVVSQAVATRATPTSRTRRADAGRGDR
jgi:hypothetical protein